MATINLPGHPNLNFDTIDETELPSFIKHRQPNKNDDISKLYPESFQWVYKKPDDSIEIWILKDDTKGAAIWERIFSGSNHISENAPTLDDDIDVFNNGDLWIQKYEEENVKLFVNTDNEDNQAKWEKLLDSKFSDNKSPIFIKETTEDWALDLGNLNHINVIKIADDSFITLTLPDPATTENGERVRFILDKGGQANGSGFSITSTYIYEYANIDLSDSGNFKPVINGDNISGERESIELVSDGATYWHIIDRAKPTQYSDNVQIYVPQDFPTINDAYNWCLDNFATGAKVVINLDDGTHILPDAIIISNKRLDLSMVGNGRDLCTVEYTGTGSYAIGAFYNTDIYLHGLTVENAGIYAQYSSSITAAGGIPIRILNAPSTGIFAVHGSSISTPSIDVVSQGIGYQAAKNSTGDCRDATINSSADGIRCDDNSHMYANHVTVTAASECVYATQGGFIWLGGNSVITGGAIGVRAVYQSYVYAVGATVTGYSNTNFLPAYRTYPTTGNTAGCYIY